MNGGEVGDAVMRMRRNVGIGRDGKGTERDCNVSRLCLGYAPE